MKDKIIELSDWVQGNWLALVLFLAIFWMIFLAIIAISWFCGYWYNAMFDVKAFEIASCWTGIQAVGTALMSILGLAGTAWAKYHTDSKFNTEPGRAPGEKGDA